MKKEELKRRKLQERGITLVALVVTIIILLILAGVTLNLALGEGGIFARAKNTADRYQAAQANEQEQLSDLEGILDKYGTGGSTTGGETENTTTPPVVDDTPLVSTVTDTDHEDNKEVKDGLGNPLVIPSGFKHVEGENVEDGIVIEDANGNQFVWIPVSNIDGNNNETGTGLIKTKEKGEVEITLGRYTFKNALNGTADLPNGTSELVQKGSERTEDISLTFHYSSRITYDCLESTNLERTNGGVGAKSLEEFITSVENNHGYYIARYEAGKGDGNKPVSKVGAVWNNITQSVAVDTAQQMYDVNENFVSDLVNSYAWDTAIVFIEKMEDDNYANANRDTTGNTTLKETGTTNDVKCNIYDMAGNVREWTTEYSTYTSDGSNNPCVSRGGGYNGSDYYTAYRNSYGTIYSRSFVGFRPLLYVK